MAVVCFMLKLVTVELDHETRLRILFATIIVFAFRATPSVGDGIFLVDHRRAEVRRRVFWDIASDRRDFEHRCVVVVQ